MAKCTQIGILSLTVHGERTVPPKSRRKNTADGGQRTIRSHYGSNDEDAFNLLVSDSDDDAAAGIVKRVRLHSKTMYLNVYLHRHNYVKRASYVMQSTRDYKGVTLATCRLTVSSNDKSSQESDSADRTRKTSSENSLLSTIPSIFSGVRTRSSVHPQIVVGRALHGGHTPSSATTLPKSAKQRPKTRRHCVNCVQNSTAICQSSTMCTWCWSDGWRLQSIRSAILTPNACKTASTRCTSTRTNAIVLFSRAWRRLIDVTS